MGQHVLSNRCVLLLWWQISKRMVAAVTPVEQRYVLMNLIIVIFGTFRVLVGVKDLLRFDRSVIFRFCCVQSEPGRFRTRQGRDISLRRRPVPRVTFQAGDPFHMSKKEREELFAQWKKEEVQFYII